MSNQRNTSESSATSVHHTAGEIDYVSKKGEEILCMDQMIYANRKQLAIVYPKWFEDYPIYKNIIHQREERVRRLDRKIVYFGDRQPTCPVSDSIRVIYKKLLISNTATFDGKPLSIYARSVNHLGEFTDILWNSYCSFSLKNRRITSFNSGAGTGMFSLPPEAIKAALQGESNEKYEDFLRMLIQIRTKLTDLVSTKCSHSFDYVYLLVADKWQLERSVDRPLKTTALLGDVRFYCDVEKENTEFNYFSYSWRIDHIKSRQPWREFDEKLVRFFEVAEHARIYNPKIEDFDLDSNPDLIEAPKIEEVQEKEKESPIDEDFGFALSANPLSITVDRYPMTSDSSSDDEDLPFARKRGGNKFNNNAWVSGSQLPATTCKERTGNVSVLTLGELSSDDDATEGTSLLGREPEEPGTKPRSVAIVVKDAVNSIKTKGNEVALVARSAMPDSHREQLKEDSKSKQSCKGAGGLEAIRVSSGDDISGKECFAGGNVTDYSYSSRSALALGKLGVPHRKENGEDAIHQQALIRHYSHANVENKIEKKTLEIIRPPEGHGSKNNNNNKNQNNKQDKHNKRVGFESRKMKQAKDLPNVKLTEEQRLNCPENSGEDAEMDGTGGPLAVPNGMFDFPNAEPALPVVSMEDIPTRPSIPSLNELNKRLYAHYSDGSAAFHTLFQVLFKSNGGWFYHNSIGMDVDERLDKKLENKSESVYSVRGNYYKRKASFMSCESYLAFIFYSIAIPFLWTFLVWMSSRTRMFHLFSAKFVDRFSAFQEWNYDLVSVYFSYVWILWIILLVYVVWSMWPRRDKMFDVSINLAHLVSMVSRQIDCNFSLTGAKMTGANNYPSSLNTLLSNREFIRRWITGLRQGTLFEFLEPVDGCPVPLRPDEEQLHYNDIKFFDSATEKYGAIRAFFVSIGQIDETRNSVSIPEVNELNIRHSAYKRLYPEPRVASEQYCARLATQLDNLRTPIDHECMDIQAYCEVYINKHKSMSKGLKAVWRRNAEMLGSLDPQELFIALKEGFAHSKLFLKDEVYNTDPEVGKALRFIYSPDIAVKLIFGAALHSIEVNIYTESGLTKHLIKHMSTVDIQNLFIERFQDVGNYVETDYTSFESSISSNILKEEYAYYARCTDDPVKKMIIGEIGRVNSIVQSVRMQGVAEFKMPSIRYSGMPNTAVGNAILNIANCRIAAEDAGVVIADQLVEGDDSMLKFNSKEDASAWLDAMKNINMPFILTDVEILNKGTDGSFCGLHMGNGSQLIVTDSQWNKLYVIFSKVKPSPARVCELILARLLSMRARCPASEGEIQKHIKTLKDFAASRKVKVHTSHIFDYMHDDYVLCERMQLDDDQIYEQIQDFISKLK